MIWISWVRLPDRSLQIRSLLPAGKNFEQKLFSTVFLTGKGFERAGLGRRVYAGMQQEKMLCGKGAFFQGSGV